MSEVVATTELLRFSVPSTAKVWGIEQKQGLGWKDCKYKLAESGPPTGSFDLEDLSIETILARWGEGTYRLIWRKTPGTRRLGESMVFRASMATVTAAPAPEGPDASQIGPDQLSMWAAGAPLHELPHPTGHNGNGHRPPPPPPRSSNGHPPITAPLLPPQTHVDPVRWGEHRKHDPVALYFTMRHAFKEEVAEWRAAEERRERQFQSVMDLRMAQVQANERIRIAEANQRAETDRARAAELSEELNRMRELAHTAAIAQADGKSQEVIQALQELNERLEEQLEHADEDGAIEGANPTAAIIAQVAERLLPPVVEALAGRLAPSGPAHAPNPEIIDAPDPG